MRGALELAAEINEQLGLPKDAKFEIAKVHFLPEMFFEEIDEAPKRIIYIYRDIRDVVVSAYFYFNDLNETDMRITKFCSLLAGGPSFLLGYYRGRKKMARYIEDLCIGNLDWFNEFTGTWSQHVISWWEMKRQRADLRFVSASYEQLLSDTASVLLEIIQKLGLSKPSDAQVHTAVERQSLEALRRHFKQSPSEVKTPFTKEFNLKFLRKGKSGDWRNFLSPQMGRIIHKYHGEMLFELGYESDPKWYSKLRASR